MPLYVNVPIDNPQYHNQTELLDVDDETFQHSFDWKKPNLPVKIYRFLCFIVFLGPIRIILTLLSVLLIYITFCILPLFKGRFKTGRSFKEWAYKVMHPIWRLLLFSIGIVHVKINGEVNYDTRTVIANHLTGVDAVTLFYTFPSMFLATAGIKDASFVYRGRMVFDQIYVDRTKKEGVTQIIRDAQNDPDKLPVAIFPEGRVTNGSCVLGFRHGAFVNDSQLQAVAIRYRHWLMPESMATISWVEWNFFHYIYQLYSVPFYTVETTILPPVVYDSSIPIEKRAIEAELSIANTLGCPAISRTNKGVRIEKPKEKED